MLVLSVGVVVMVVGTVVLVVSAAFAQRNVSDPRSTFLRIAAASGVAAMGAGVLYMLAYHRDGESATSTAAYTALVLSPSLLCVALASGRKRIAWYTVAFCVSSAMAVTISFSLLTPSQALPVLLAVMAGACAACAFLAFKNIALPRLAMRVLASAAAFYSLYCGSRMLALLLETKFMITQVLFGYVPSVLAAIVTYLAAAGAVVAVFLTSTRAARRRSHEATTLTISDWPIVIKAYGPARATQLVDELRSATRERDPHSADIKYGVATALPALHPHIIQSLTYEYGWRPDELALVVADTTTSNPTMGDDFERRAPRHSPE